MDSARRNAGFSMVPPPPVPPGGEASPGCHTGWALIVTHGPSGVRVTASEHWFRRLPDRLVPDQSGLRRRQAGPVETRTVEIGGIEVEREDCGDRWCALYAGLVSFAAILESSALGDCPAGTIAPQAMYDPSSEMDPLL